MVLSRLYDENDSPVETVKLNKKTKAWRLSGNATKRKQTVARFANTVTPEEICQYEGMLEGQQLLIRTGMTRAVKQGKKRIDGLIGFMDTDEKWKRYLHVLSKLKKKLGYRTNLLRCLKQEEEAVKGTGGPGVRVLHNLQIYRRRLQEKIKVDQEQIRCAQYMYNQLQTSS